MRPFYCEVRDFNRHGSYSFYKYDDDYLNVLESHILKCRDLVWVELMIPKFGRICGSVIRSKWRGIKKRNLNYEFNGIVHNINDIIHFIGYRISDLPSPINNITVYSKPLNLEIYIPKKYGHYRSYFDKIPKHILTHGGICECYSFKHEVLRCDFCHLSRCMECQYLSDMSIKKCQECGFYRCVKYSLDASSCVDIISRNNCKNCGYHNII